MNPIVIYHGPGCPDGWTAAWVAHRRFRARGQEAELVAAHYGDEPPDVRGREVVIVDFSYPRDVLIGMHERAASLFVLDHHQTAARELEGLPFAVFDMKRSGAGLAWDMLPLLCPDRDWSIEDVAKHFDGDAQRAAQALHNLYHDARPWVVDYVEDRDLWRWALPRSREVSAYLRTLDFDLETWDRLLEMRWEDAADRGAGIIAYIEREVARHVKHAVRCELGGHVVPVVNATTCVSEVGHALSRESPFAATWQALGEGGYVYSLRSCAENPEHVDVSEIARRFGGGGHRHAAGFKSATMVHAPAGT